MTVHYARVGEDNVDISVVLSADVESADSVVWHAVNGVDEITVTANAATGPNVSVTLTDTEITAANVGTWAQFWRVTNGADGAGPLDYPSNPKQRDTLVIKAAKS